MIRMIIPSLPAAASNSDCRRHSHPDCRATNTSKQRTHSLFRQGAMLYDLIPMMPEPRLRPLVERFGAMLLELPAFAGVYGVI
jgi:hypothetical protein